MVPASCPQRPGGGAEGCKGGAGAAVGDRGGRCALGGNSGVLSAQRGRRPRIVVMGRARLAAKVLRTTEGSGILDREGPWSCVASALGRGARTGSERSLLASGGRLGGL